MKNLTRYRVGLLLALSFFIKTPLHAEILTTEGVTAAPNTFARAVNSMVLDKGTGNLYVGLVAGVANNFNLATIGRPTTTAAATTPTFTAMATGTATLTTPAISNLAFIPHAPTDPATTAGQGTLIMTIAADPTSVTACTNGTPALYDTASAGTTIQEDDGTAATRILALAGGNTHGLAVVKGAANNNWGADANDCLSMFSATSTPGGNNYVFAHVAKDGAAANELDTAANGHFVGTTNGAAGAGTFGDVHYDGRLQKAYVTSQLITSGANAEDVAYGFVAFDVVETPGSTAVTLSPQAGTTDAERLAAIPASANSIVGAKAPGAASITVGLYNIDTMHTSTGYPYLITIGGLINAGVNDRRNDVRAMPLVKVGNPGAGKLSSASLNSYDTPIADGDNTLPIEADLNTKVGASLLPIKHDSIVSGMQVVGDTVYCSISQIAAAGADEPGIYYSQAMFNEYGKIIRWTLWEKAVPDAAAGDVYGDGRSSFFAVDPVGGRIWSVPTVVTLGTNLAAIKMSSWFSTTATGNPANSFIGQMERFFDGEPCYSVFDINNTVRKWCDEIPSRYALFGGLNKVVAIRTSVASGDRVDFVSPSFERSSGVGGWNIAANQAMDISSGLEDAGPVMALEWTGQAAGDDNNYFLAGTPTGLYIFRRNTAIGGKVGLDLTSLDAVAATDVESMATEPFGTAVPFSWELTSLTEPVLNIVTDNLATFVHTRVTGTDGTTVDKVYRYTGAGNTTVALFNAAQVQVAQTGRNSLAGVTTINDIALVSSRLNGEVNELALATDVGIYVSHDTGLLGMAPAAATEATANYTRKTTPLNTHNLSYSHHTDQPRTLLATTEATSNCNDPSTPFGSISRNENLLQTSFSNTSLVFGLKAFSKNVNSNTDGRFAEFTSMGRSLGGTRSHALWSNGAYRMMLTDQTDGSSPFNKVFFAPFDVSTSVKVTTALPDVYNGYNITSPVEIPDANLDDINVIYWAQQVGDRICMGTDQGIASLE